MVVQIHVNYKLNICIEQFVKFVIGSAEEIYLLFFRENYYRRARGGAYLTIIYYFKIEIIRVKIDTKLSVVPYNKSLLYKYTLANFVI